MEISKRLKKLIFKYLLKDLYKVEIIYYRDSVWFIDRENRYWYFEYHKLDKHLWWRWSHFTTALTMFSMGAEQEQHLFGELVNMILTKKQKLEAKYPNKVFKTVGSVMNFEDKVDEVLNYEVEKTLSGGARKSMEAHKILDQEVNTTYQAVQSRWGDVDKVLNNEVKTTGKSFPFQDVWVDEVLNSEVKTTGYRPIFEFQKVDEVLNCEVETTSGTRHHTAKGVDEVLNCEVETTGEMNAEQLWEVDKVLNNEVETTSGSDIAISEGLGEVLNYEVETTDGYGWKPKPVVDEVLNCEVETTIASHSGVYRKVDEVLDSDVKISGGEMIEEDEMMNKVLEIQNIQPAERGANDMVDFVLDVEDYTVWDWKLKPLVNKVLDSTVEIKSIRKLKGESPLQDIIVSHILDESDKVTDKLKMKEDDYVKTYSHDVYMCDHLVQNVLDIGVNSIHYDTHNHQPIVDGILKKA